MNIPRYAKPLAFSVFGLGLLAIATAIVWSSRVPANTSNKSAAPAASAPSGPTSVVDGVTIIRLDTATQQKSGIVVKALVGASRRGETQAYGQVLDLQPLIELRGRHDAAQADLTATRAAAFASKAEAERSRALYEDQRNVSLKVLEAAQAAQRADQAKADAAELAVRNLEATAEQQYGQVLVSAAFEPHSAAFARLAARQDTLVRLTLQLVGGLQPPSDLEVQTSGGPKVSGSLVSASAQVDPGQVGTSYLYRVSRALPAGAPVVGYLPTSAHAIPGVLVPATAIVWFAGQPWAYVQKAPTEFARRPLGSPEDADGDYFVPTGFKPGERVVTSGAGLLLSEEQRPPPGSPACKDPECD
jgi:hypothetical protein